MREVAITGAGAVTPLGATLDATRAALAAGRVATGPCRAFDASAFRAPDAGEVPEFDVRSHFRMTKALKVTDRRSRFAVAAAAMALESGAWGARAGDRLGVLVGTSTFDLQVGRLASAVFPDPARATTDIPFFGERILSGVTPLWLLMVLPNMTSSHVGIQLSASGPNSTIMSDEAAGLQALGEASEWIRRGECEAVLAGGADTIVTPAGFAALAQADAARTPPAEGAAMLLLEDGDGARGRGATIRGWLRGYGTATGPCATSRAIGQALRDSGWAAADIDCVCGGEVAGIEGFRPDARRVSVAGAIGNAAAAGAPASLAVALSAEAGSRLLCLVAEGVGPAAAIAVEVAS